MPDGHIYMQTLGAMACEPAAVESNGVSRPMAAVRHALSQAWSQLTRSAVAIPLEPEPATEPATSDEAAPSHGECVAALERVLASVPFRSAPSRVAFLRFVAEAALSGRTRSIKAYTVALGALARGDDFDPIADPVVRVTAGRVRNALTRYYAGPGAGDPVLITVPLGSYVPLFRRRDAVEA